MATVRTHAMAHGGEAIGRLDSGKTVFVAGGLPGEVLTLVDLVERDRWGRAGIGEIVEPSPARVEAPCPYAGTCGGCQWQHVDYPAQLEYKRSIVEGQLRHLGGLADPVVRATVAPGPSLRYRNKMNFQVVGGATGQYQAGSHDLVPIDACLLLVPELSELYGRIGDLPDVSKIVIRHGTRTGDSMVVVDGPVPAEAAEWGASVVRRDGTKLRVVHGSEHLHEVVAGVRLRITGPAFFQVNTPGADALVDLVGEIIRPTAGDVLLDAYSGGGLFTVTVGATAERVVAIETGGHSVADFRHNVRASGIDHAEIIEGRVEATLTDPVDEWSLAICDPPRTGMGRAAIEGIVTPRPRAIAYVSCDPASFARDVRIFGELGYTLSWAAPVDLFPQTFHIETVGCLVRDDAEWDL